MDQRRRSHPRPAGFSDEVWAHLGKLAIELIESGRSNDRARFNRLFMVAFGTAYGAAWQETGNAATAQRLAAVRLVRAIRMELASSGGRPAEVNGHLLEGISTIGASAVGRIERALSAPASASMDRDDDFAWTKTRRGRIKGTD